MENGGLYLLYKLHKIDAALHEMKLQAAALDQGQEAAAKLKTLMESSSEVREKSKTLSHEQKELELEQKALEDKVKKFDQQLFSGSISNAREVENVQKEIVMLKGLIDKHDERLLELMDELPPIKKEADAVEAEMAKLQLHIAERKKLAVQEHEALKARYQETAKLRPAAAARVPKPLLDLYEPLKAKHGTGMALITNTSNCGTCGMAVAERSAEMVKMDRPVQCNACRRILFSLLPGVEH